MYLWSRLRFQRSPRLTTWWKGQLPRYRPSASNFGPQESPKDMGSLRNQNCCKGFRFARKFEKHWNSRTVFSARQHIGLCRFGDCFFVFRCIFCVASRPTSASDIAWNTLNTEFINHTCSWRAECMNTAVCNRNDKDMFNKSNQKRLVSEVTYYVLSGT